MKAQDVSVAGRHFQVFGSHMFTMRAHTGEPMEGALYDDWLVSRRRTALGYASHTVGSESR
jgi:hypothetical protein